MEDVNDIYQRIDGHCTELLQTQTIEAGEAVWLGDLLEARMTQRERETEVFNQTLRSSMEMLATCCI